MLKCRYDFMFMIDLLIFLAQYSILLNMQFITHLIQVQYNHISLTILPSPLFVNLYSDIKNYQTRQVMAFSSINELLNYFFLFII